MDDLLAVLGIIIGFVGGLFSGLVVERYRVKHDLQIYRIQKLSPYLDHMYPILKDLNDDCRYAVELQSSGRSNAAPLRKLCRELSDFQSSYNEFREAGMEPHLEPLNGELHSLLLGLFNASQLYSKHGSPYVSQNLDAIQRSCLHAKEALEKQFKA